MTSPWLDRSDPPPMELQHYKRLHRTSIPGKARGDMDFHCLTEDNIRNYRPSTPLLWIERTPAGGTVVEKEPGTQDAIRSDQEKEVGLMKKVDEFEKMEELQGQREQLAVALQVRHALQSSS